MPDGTDVPARPDAPTSMVRMLRGRQALSAAIVVGVACGVGSSLAAPAVPATTRGVVSWDLATLTFLIEIARRMGPLTPEQLSHRAKEQDQGRHAILTLCLAAAVISIAAIGFELLAAKDLHGTPRAEHVVLALVTVALSWSFVHAIFAVHYAHEYYAPDEGAEGERLREGLRFPGDAPPDVWDFVHFAVVIGVAAQTADVAITSKPIRRLVTVHGLVAFVFNTVLLALSINLAASLFL